jgi:hypothetical protein
VARIATGPDAGAAGGVVRWLCLYQENCEKSWL